MPPAPIFLLSCGRSGSTLLQRLLNLSPDLTIWGEHGGFLRGIAESYFRYHESEEIGSLMCNTPESYQSLIGAAPPDELPYWHNSLNDARLAAGMQGMLRGFFASELPEGVRWGFKEVRYGHEDRVIAMLRALFPDGDFLYLFRHPHDYARSALNAWQADEILGYDHEQIRHQYNLHLVRWQYNTRFYLDHLRAAEGRTLALTFEALTQSPEEESAKLFTALGIAPPAEESIAAVFAQRPNRARGDVVERLDAVTPKLQTNPESLQLWEEIQAATINS